MRKTGIRYCFFILLPWLAGCSDFLAGIEKHTDWVVSEQGRVVLHTRPPDFSNSASPAMGDISLVLDCQNHYLLQILDTLQIDFQARVIIYLFNLDESLDAIGMQEGGHTVAERSVIYHVFRRPAWLDVNGRLTYMGARYMAQLITRHELGSPYTRLMDEGYATALSGAYGKRTAQSGNILAKPVLQWMHEHYANGNILTPARLLYEDHLDDEIFAPNAAFFISYLWQRFGIQKINQLFNVGSENFEARFRQVTSTPFEQLAADYLNYCNQVLN